MRQLPTVIQEFSMNHSINRSVHTLPSLSRISFISSLELSSQSGRFSK